MSHASSDERPAAVPRAESLAKIGALAASLRARRVTPPDAFVWTYHEDSRWWAFGPYGRFTVAVPQRFGWPVGDYPWEGVVKQAPETFASEIFVKPTFVDAHGQIAPLDATRASPTDNHLLTDEMCAEIAARMEQIATGPPPGDIPSGEGPPPRPH